MKTIKQKQNLKKICCVHLIRVTCCLVTNGYKIEQVFNTIDECKVFKSLEEWYNLQRQMRFYSKILQVI